MKLTFLERSRSGWKPRGRPAAPVPPEILDVLEKTLDTGKVGVVDTRGDSPEDVAHLKQTLRRGARLLGRRVRLQEEQGVVRFELGPPLPSRRRTPT